VPPRRSGRRAASASTAAEGSGEQGSAAEPPPASRSRKRRRPPPSDWQFPLLTDWGFRPEQQRLLVIVASVLGGVAGVAGLIYLIGSLGGESSSDRPAGSALVLPDTVRPESFRGWGSPKLFEPVGTRAKDPQPLTEKELFAGKTLTGEKKPALKLVKSELGKDCAAALWGQDLVDRVADGECTQVARAMYKSTDGRYVAQYTLLNLRDAKSADGLVTYLRSGYRGGWTYPLKTAKAAFPAGGHTVAGGYALGHYVGLLWLGRVDGGEPTAKDDFVSLTLTLRAAEKPVYRRVVTIAGTPK
jgi:hypothetical protein